MTDTSAVAVAAPPGYGAPTLKSWLAVAAIVALTLVLLPIQAAILKLRLRIWWAIPLFYHRVALKIIGVQVRVHGARSAVRPTLYVSNHVSWLDIPIIGAALPASFIAKREVGDWGPFGSLARLHRTLFVDRERRGQVHAQNNEIAERLAAGDNLVLFAEGTSTDGSIVLPFKSALLAVAEPSVCGRDELTIQPVTIAYRTLNGLPLGRATRPLIGWYGDMALEPHFLTLLGLGRIGVDLIFHAPINSRDFASRKTIAAHCHETVRRGLMATRRESALPGSGG